VRGNPARDTDDDEVEVLPRKLILSPPHVSALSVVAHGIDGEKVDTRGSE
jgi:hypothetical protein